MRLFFYDVGVCWLVKVLSVVWVRLGIVLVGSVLLGWCKGWVGVVCLVMVGWGVVGDDWLSVYYVRRGVFWGVDWEVLGKVG